MVTLAAPYWSSYEKPSLIKNNFFVRKKIIKGILKCSVIKGAMKSQLLLIH